MEPAPTIGYATRVAATHRHPDRGRTFTAPRMSDSPRSARRGDRRTIAADRAGAGRAPNGFSRCHRHPHRRARVRPSGRDRQRRCGTDSAGSAADQPVRVAGARAGAGHSESLELCAGPSDLIPRLRRSGELRRAWHTPVPGRHSGDDAGRSGTDGKLQSRFRAAHRGLARAVLDPLR